MENKQPIFKPNFIVVRQFPVVPNLEVFENRLFSIGDYRIIFPVGDVICPCCQSNENACNLVSTYFTVKKQIISVRACIKKNPLNDIIIGVGFAAEVNIDSISNQDGFTLYVLHQQTSLTPADSA